MENLEGMADPVKREKRVLLGLAVRQETQFTVFLVYPVQLVPRVKKAIRVDQVSMEVQEYQEKRVTSVVDVSTVCPELRAQRVKRESTVEMEM
jgi:hypothetical protein